MFSAIRRRVRRAVDRAAWAVEVHVLEPRRMFAGGVRVAAGDLTGDGVADMVVAQADLDGGGGFAITPFLSRKGGGRPVRSASVDISAKEFAALCVGDLTGDGRADIIVASARKGGGAGGGGSGGTIVIYAGDGRGNVHRDAAGAPITKTIALAGAGAASSIIAADFDGDGATDLAVVYPTKPIPPREAGSGLATGRRMQLDITWGAPGGGLSGETVGNSIDEDCDGIATGDVDGDGAPDLVAFSTAEEQLKGNPRHRSAVVTVTNLAKRTPTISDQPNPILLGQPGSSTSSNPSVYTLGLGDANGDGVAELIGLISPKELGGGGGGGAGGSVILSAGFDPVTGRWKAPELNSHSDTHVVIHPSTGAISDFNGDGRADLRLYSPADDTWAFGDSGISPEGEAKLIWSPRSNLELYH